MTAGGRPPVGAVPLPVVVASANPAKVRAVEAALGLVFGERVGTRVGVGRVAVPSGVSEQPVGDEETRRGALNRARAALAASRWAALAVGVEGGVGDAGLAGSGPDWSFSWVVALARDGTLGEARSATFRLSAGLVERLRAGAELGAALDAEYSLVDARSGLGAVGVLTGGLIDRSALTRDAVVLALSPWLSR